jgi:hypothetical protein
MTCSATLASMALDNTSTRAPSLVARALVGELEVTDKEEDDHFLTIGAKP